MIPSLHHLPAGALQSLLRRVVGLVGLALVTGAISIVGPAASGAAAKTETEQAHQAGLEAYLHGFPPLISAASQKTFPVNTLVGVAGTTTPQNRLVVLPNVDTAYAVARLDLRGGPMVVHVPSMAGRYYTVEFLDAYTNVIGNVGTGSTGNAPGDYAIAGPGTQGSVAGLPTVHSPTPDALLLGRTLIEPRDDRATLRQVLGSFALTPESTLASGGKPSPSVVINRAPKSAPATVPQGLAFLSAFDQLLAADPPNAAEQRSLASLARFGIGPGLSPSSTHLSTAARRALRRGVDDGPARLQTLVDRRQNRSIRANAGWIMPYPHTGEFGTRWTLRAIIAETELFANRSQVAVYPVAANDGQGRSLTGHHSYALTFQQRLPARAFWSVTMYAPDGRLYANPEHRYGLGDRSPGLHTGPHGSVRIALQHRPPMRDRGSWLPSPSGHFKIALRLYGPSKAARDGDWAPPGIKCLDCRNRKR